MMQAYTYVSTKAGYDPCKTMFLCGPSDNIRSIEDCSRYAEKSGWLELVEREAAVLIMPVSEQGYSSMPYTALSDLYDELKNSFDSKSGHAIWGRAGKLWCWETVLYVVSDKDAIAWTKGMLGEYPNTYAGVALMESGEQDTDSYVYHLPEGTSAQDVYSSCFEHSVRWKTGRGGRLAHIESKKEFYDNQYYIEETVSYNGNQYDYFIHIPKGLAEGNAKDMPLVYTIHGRGEPAWMFMQKNGWCELADKTGEFIVLSVDSPGNIWFNERDGGVFELITQRMIDEYHIDATRVYLTGFSNGAIIIREVAYTYPRFWAAIAPSNGPWFDTYSMQREDTSTPPQHISDDIQKIIDRYIEEGWEMPCAFFYGDSDPAAKAAENQALPVMLRSNRCENSVAKVYDGTNYFKKESGYEAGDRFHSEVYTNSRGEDRVVVTVMKDMPHGAIEEETKYTWEFMRCYSRKDGSKTVTYNKNI